MDASFMSLLLHERGNHAVSLGGSGSRRRISGHASKTGAHRHQEGTRLPRLVTEPVAVAIPVCRSPYGHHGKRIGSSPWARVTIGGILRVRPRAAGGRNFMPIA